MHTVMFTTIIEIQLSYLLSKYPNITDLTGYPPPHSAQK